MGRLIGSRLVAALPGVIGVIIVTFVLTRALPGDPAAYFAGPAATQQAIAEIRHSLGLDRSLPEQFVVYVEDLAHGRLGNSLSTGQPVIEELLTRLPASIELTVLALLCGSWLISTRVLMPLSALGSKPRLKHRDYSMHGWTPTGPCTRRAASDRSMIRNWLNGRTSRKRWHTGCSLRETKSPRTLSRICFLA